MRVPRDLAAGCQHPVRDGLWSRVRDGEPHVDLCDACEAARPEHAAIGEDEIRRHHAHDLCGVGRELDGPPDDSGIGAEAAAPVAVAEDHHARWFICGERPAQGCRASQQVEERRGDEHGERNLGAGVRLQFLWRDERVVRLEACERRVQALEVEEVRRREGIARPSLLCRVAPDIHQPIRVTVGQRPDQHAVDHGEDRRRRADAQAERGNRQQREERRLDGQPEGVADVGAQRVPEHVMSPVRRVEVRACRRTPERSMQGNGALGEAAPNRREQERQEGSGRRTCVRCRVRTHLGAEATPERAREAEERDGEQPGGRPIAPGHGRAFSSCRDAAAATWLASRSTSARATAMPRSVSR